MVPARETELADLMRDYGTLQEIYADLQKKNEESKVAANLERRQIGEQFKLLDPARMPEKPFSPNRPLINLLGAAAGLVIGLGLVAFLEYRDTSFRTEEDVTRLLGMPVLARIPLMITELDQRRMQRQRMVRSTAMVASAFVIGVIVWKLGAFDALLR